MSPQDDFKQYRFNRQHDRYQSASIRPVTRADCAPSASKDGVVIPRSAAEFALSEIRYSATNYYECSPSEADNILSEGKYADADYIAIKQALAQEGEV